MSELAIVIPAYKNIYFDKALLSIANQSCKDFTLYIGDDSSPYDLKSIIAVYQDQINIVYKHFDTNIGGKNLVAQWERCIDLVKDENWIWLFSDDDIMDPDCVKNFYLTLDQYPQFDLFHFNVTHIDDERNIHNQITNFPEILTSEEFLKISLNGGYSFVVEYIFRKSHFYDTGRFQYFDLAWCSDTATWIKLAKRSGIRNIPDTNVYFRTSLFNITSNYRDVDIVKRKFYSQIEYSNWIYEQVKQNEIHLGINQIKNLLKNWFYGGIKAKIDHIPFGVLGDLICQFNRKLFQEKCPILKVSFFNFYKFYRFFLGILKKILLWNQLKLLISKFSMIYILLFVLILM